MNNVEEVHAKIIALLERHQWFNTVEDIKAVFEALMSYGSALHDPRRADPYYHRCSYRPHPRVLSYLERNAESLLGSAQHYGFLPSEMEEIVFQLNSAREALKGRGPVVKGCDCCPGSVFEGGNGCADNDSAGNRIRMDAVAAFLGCCPKHVLVSALSTKEYAFLGRRQWETATEREAHLRRLEALEAKNRRKETPAQACARMGLEASA